MLTARTSLVSLALLSLIAVPASAADAPSKAGQAVWSKVLERLDLNKNQSIEVEELAVRLQQVAQQTDADHNGQITPDEFRSAARKVRQTVGERVRTAADERRTGQTPKVSIAAVEQRVHQALQTADADQNGELTRAELHRAMHAAIGKAQERIAAHRREHRDAVAAAVARRHQQRAQVLAAVAQRIEQAHPEATVSAAAIRLLDTNDDQLLQWEELHSRGERLFSLADADHDRAVSDSELQQALVVGAKFVRERVEKRLAEITKRVAKK